jgi:outer membrane protein insertion porin family
MKLCCGNGLRALALLAVLLGSGAARGQEATAKSPTENLNAGPQVVELRLVLEDGRVLPNMPPGAPVGAGKPLRRSEVAETIRILYKTGDYADVRAVSTPEDGGVRLDFVVKENLFISQVLIQGLKEPPSESSGVAAMQLSLGQTYHAADVQDALDRLREVLKEEGLYQAKVTVEQRAQPATHQIDVIAHVEPGPRVRLSRLEMTNRTNYRDQDLLKQTKLRPGRELTVARVQQANDRIRKFLEKKGHLSARVSARRGEFDPATNTIPIELEVSEGPRVLVEVSGVKLSKGQVKKLVPVYQERSVDTDLLEEGKRNLRERLERDGYFNATVEYSLNSKEVQNNKTGWKGTEETITYKVDKGDRHKLLRIEFSGNHFFGTDLLRSRLTITPSALFVKPRFSRRLLDAEVQSIKSLYAANGFSSARVQGVMETNAGGKSGDLVVRFEIEEGKQTLVSSLTISGAAALKEEEIRGVVGSLPGQPYSEINVAKDRDNILAMYFNQGFPNATFSWTAEPDVAGKAETPAERQNEEKGKASGMEENIKKYHIERAEPMRLVYKMEEGTQVRVKDVLLTGYKHTKPKVIRREVKVIPNAPLREGDVVESQQKLYNLGVFNRVTIEPQNANGADPNKDVVVLVEETKRYTIAYGGGFEVQRLASTTDPTGGQIQAAPRGLIEISKQNLTGRADSLSFKLRGSTIQGRALLAYAEPNILNHSSLSLQATAYTEKTQDINTFTQTRYEGNLQLTHQLSPRSSFLYRYAFRKVTVSKLNIPTQEVPLFNQPTLVSQFSLTWFRDTRDNPADATKGMFNSADVSIAGTKLGSSANFARYFFQNSTYTPINRNWGFARSVRLGILQPFGNTISLTFPAPTGTPVPEVIPLPERFFGGGGTSLRGFGLNQAGPRDTLTGFPVGGQAMLILNQEIRFPMKLPFVGSRLGGAIFYDGGNVYSRLSKITFRWKPDPPVFATAYPGKPGPFNPQHCVANCTNELNYFSHTIGLGLRYATPVGPIRIDMGYELNQPEFVIPCKNSRPLCQQGTRLPKFQIFFNLGSSF